MQAPPPVEAAWQGSPAGTRPPRKQGAEERKYRDGERVRHAAFGEGTVVSGKVTDFDEEVTVAFPEIGIKRLSASFAPLEKLA